MDFDLYKRWMQAEGGSVVGSNTNSTINAINNSFTESPYYAQGKLNGVTDIDWHINGSTNEKNQFQEKEFLFRPNAQYERGDYLVTDSDSWLIIDRNYTNPIFPKASVSLCNDSMQWVDAVGNRYSYSCATIPYRAIRSILNDNQQTNLPSGHMFVWVQANVDTEKIVLKQRFILGRQVYEITGIDDSNYMYNGKGSLYMTVSVTTKDNFNDDFVNRIADNSFLYKGSTPTPSMIQTTGENTTQTSGGVKSGW